VFAQKRQPRGARHDLEVALQAGVHLGAVDHGSRGRVVGHLLQGHRRAQHVAGEFLSPLGIFGCHPHVVVRRETATGPGFEIVSEMKAELAQWARVVKSANISAN